MGIEIRRLSCELIQDYFDFFEHRAFTDNYPYWCYCQVYQMSKEESSGGKSLRNGAGVASLPLYCSRQPMRRKMTVMSLLMDCRKSEKNAMSGIRAVR